jgi:hypothetical protein
MEFVLPWLRAKGARNVSFATSRAPQRTALASLDPGMSETRPLHHWVMCRTKWCACRDTMME